MQSTRIFFLFLIVWLLVGWGIWTVAAAEQQNSKAIAINTLSSPEFNVILHDLFTERTTVLSTHLSNMYDNHDTRDTAQELNNNMQKLADIVEVLSTKEDRDIFVATLQKHVEDAELYAIGLKERDNNKLELAQQLLDSDTTNFAVIIHKVFPTVSQTYASIWMKEQNILMVTFINSHATNDTAKQYNTLNDSSMHANSIADELVKDIRVKKEQNK